MVRREGEKCFSERGLFGALGFFLFYFLKVFQGIRGEEERCAIVKGNSEDHQGYCRSCVHGWRGNKGWNVWCEVGGRCCSGGIAVCLWL